MRGWVRLVLAAAGLTAVVAAGAYWWLLADPGAPAEPPFRIDIAQVRALAANLPGDKAAAVRVEVVATGSVPQALALAGGGWSSLPIGFLAYQLVFPGQTMVIDAAADEATARGFNAAFDADAFAAVIAALDRAAQVVVTQEHADHLGAILAHPRLAAIAERLSLTLEQIAAAPGYVGGDTASPVLAQAKPIVYEDYFPVAPGVVLIKAPGHTPGSQLVFVALADGREYLFAGDVGWSLANFGQARGRPRLTGELALHEERGAVLAQLRAINALMAAEPGLIVVPGHDLDFVRGAVARGNLTEGFAAP